VAQTADPLGGSYFVEALTDEMERVIRAIMDEIEARGGMVECLRQGFIQQRIAQRAYEHQRAVEKGEVVVVAVNKFAGAEKNRDPDLELQQGSAEAAREAAERVRKVKRERDREAAHEALDRLSRAAQERGNLQAFIRDAVAAYCTVGEIAAVLKANFGAYQPPTKF
jgi:methylmalonyl-CoA mutase N-terminal domain/subunit